jgi:hypothetical protein
MIMIRSLVLLLDLLTNYQAVEALARCVFTFGMANTALACFLGSFEILRRIKVRRPAVAPSRA